MYTNLVVLDNENHKTLKLSPVESFAFAKKTTFIPVVTNEVALVGAHFPVVFTADENTSLISLLSLSGDNLGVDEDGKWISVYIPSFLRKYPFSLANT